MAARDEFEKVINEHKAGTKTIISINMKSGNNYFIKRSIPGTIRIENDCVKWEEFNSGLRADYDLVHFVSDIDEISHLSYVDGFDENKRENFDETEYPLAIRQKIKDFVESLKTSS